MEKLDYALIRDILQLLAKDSSKRGYPWELANSCGYDENGILEHLIYLNGHGMIQGGYAARAGGNYSRGKANITCRGIDFLQPEGGLTALFSSVVHIAPENLAEIIDAALAARGADTAERTLARKCLEEATLETMRGVAQRLLHVGISHTANLIELISKGFTGQ